MRWTTEMDDTLKRMALKGYSMAQIADQLNCGLTRSACIGRWHRLTEADKTLSLPVKTKLSPGAVGARKKRRMPALVQAIREEDVAAPAAKPGRLLPLTPVVPAGPSVGILDVTGCKWPIGEDPKVYGLHTFCNAPRDENQAYCEHHRVINRKAKVEPEKVERFRVPISLVRAGAA